MGNLIGNRISIPGILKGSNAIDWDAYDALNNVDIKILY